MTKPMPRRCRRRSTPAFSTARNQACDIEVLLGRRLRPAPFGCLVLTGTGALWKTVESVLRITSGWTAAGYKTDTKETPEEVMS
jgi:hypothetical protein